MNPVQGFKEAPAAAKVATVVGAAAVIGSAVYAAKSGKVADVFKKAEEGAEKLTTKQKLGEAAKRFGKGYKNLGSAIKTWVTEKLPKAKEKVADTVEEGAEKAAE